MDGLLEPRDGAREGPVMRRVLGLCRPGMPVLQGLWESVYAGIVGACLEQQHRAPRVLGEARRQHTTGRSRPNDDDIVLHVCLLMLQGDFGTSRQVLQDTLAV